MSSDLSVFEGCIVEFGKKFRQGVNIPRASRKDVVKKAYEIVSGSNFYYANRFKGFSNDDVIKEAVNIVNRHEENKILEYSYLSEKYKELKEKYSSMPKATSTVNNLDMAWYDDKSSSCLFYEDETFGTCYYGRKYETLDEHNIAPGYRSKLFDFFLNLKYENPIRFKEIYGDFSSDNPDKSKSLPFYEQMII